MLPQPSTAAARVPTARSPAGSSLASTPSGSKQDLQARTWKLSWNNQKSPRNTLLETGRRMAERSVSDEDRRIFLMWLGANHEFKQPEAVDVLRFFLSAPERLPRLRIIEDCSYLRPLVVVAAVGQCPPGLLYQTGSGSCRDGRSILTDLALTQGPVYLVPYFPHRTEARLYLAAREEGIRPVSETFGGLLADLETAELMASLGRAAKRGELLFLIDQALERRDRSAFDVLVVELKKLPHRQDLILPGRKESR